MANANRLKYFTATARNSVVVIGFLAVGPAHAEASTSTAKRGPASANNVPAIIGPCVTNANQASKWVYEVSFNSQTSRLEGWAFDERNPCKKIVGAIWMDGKKLADWNANQPSTALSTAVDSVINNGFSVVVPANKVTGQDKTVRFKRGGKLLFETVIKI